MITYNEAYDINHTIYRILLLLHSLKFNSVEFERLRIWDFYMAFPYEIGNIRFGVKPEDRNIKKLFPKRTNPYRKITNPRKLYSRMQPYQLTAINKLASYGIIANDHESVGRIRVINREKLEDILEHIGVELDTRQSNVMKILTTYFYFMDFYGEGGLKARTKLSEYHYDE